VTLILLLGLTAAALFLRLGYIRQTTLDRPVRGDAIEYVQYGWNLHHYGTFSKSRGDTLPPAPDSLRSPGYPLFIALSLWIGGGERYAGLALHTQAALGALMVLLTFLLGRFFLPSWAALIAAALVAFSPHLVTVADNLLTETLFGFSLLLGLVLFFSGVRTGRIAYMVIAGVVLGGSYLVNEAAALVPFLLGITVLTLDRRRGSGGYRSRTSRGVIAFLVVFTVFPAGWLLRGHLNVPPDAPRGSDRALRTLADGTYPGPLLRRYPGREDPQYEEYAASFPRFIEAFSQRLRDRPLRYLSWYFLEKPRYWWSWGIQQGQGDVYVYPIKSSLYQRSRIADGTRGLAAALHPILIMLLLFSGALWIWSRGWVAPRSAIETPVLLLILLTAYTALYSIMFPLPRYAIPFKPEFYLCAMWPVSVMAGALDKSLTSHRTIAWLERAGAWIVGLIFLVTLSTLDRADAADRNAERAEYIFPVAFSTQRAGERERAIQLYELSLELNPSHRQAAFNLGYTYLRGDSREEWSRSIPLFERVLALDPSYTEALFHIATAYRRLDNETEGARYDRLYLERGSHRDLRQRALERLGSGR
jgi:tetratricopeptide (TPR) repeat protein